MCAFLCLSLGGQLFDRTRLGIVHMKLTSMVPNLMYNLFTKPLEIIAACFSFKNAEIYGKLKRL